MAGIVISNSTDVVVTAGNVSGGDMRDVAPSLYRLRIDKFVAGSLVETWVTDERVPGDATFWNRIDALTDAAEKFDISFLYTPQTAPLMCQGDPAEYLVCRTLVGDTKAIKNYNPIPFSYFRALQEAAELNDDNPLWGTFVWVVIPVKYMQYCRRVA